MTKTHTTDPFRDASKEALPTRLSITGPSGAGKTLAALQIANRLSSFGSGKVAVLDTEGRSSLIYANKYPFRVLPLRDKYAPDEYIAAIHAAEDYGYDVLVIDSLSHAWNGAGGVLEIVDKKAESMKNNKWAGWSAGRPAQNSLANAIVNTGVHLIATMRARTSWEVVEAPGRKTEYNKVGVESVQSDEMDYEFLLSALINMEHTLTLSKTRMEEFSYGQVISDLDLFATNLHNWSTSGAPIMRGTWANEINLVTLMKKFEEKELSATDVTRITGFDDINNVINWNRKYASGQEAFNRITSKVGSDDYDPDQDLPALPKVGANADASH